MNKQQSHRQRQQKGHRQNPQRENRQFTTAPQLQNFQLPVQLNPTAPAWQTSNNFHTSQRHQIPTHSNVQNDCLPYEIISQAFSELLEQIFYA